MVLLALLLLAPAPGAGAPRRRQSAARRSPYIRLGLKSLESKDYASAIDNFSKAAKSRGDSASYFLLGYAYYQRGFTAGSPEEADKKDASATVKAYNKVLALDPGLESVSEPYRLYHGLALSYEALGEDEKAIAAYKMAIQAAPQNPMLPLYAARLRYRMNDFEKSVANLALSLQRAKATGHEGEIVALVKTDPLFSMMMASPAHQKVLRQYEPPPREKPAEMRAEKPAEPEPQPPPPPRRGSAEATRARLRLEESRPEAAPEPQQPKPASTATQAPSGSVEGEAKPRARKRTAEERRKIEEDVRDLIP